MASIEDVRRQVNVTLENGHKALGSLAEVNNHIVEARGTFGSLIIGSNNEYSSTAEATLNVGKDIDELALLIGKALAATEAFQTGL